MKHAPGIKPATITVNCPECNGSGYRWGFNREIICHDCDGEGQWTEEVALTEEVQSDPINPPKWRTV